MKHIAPAWYKILEVIPMDLYTVSMVNTNDVNLMYNILYTRRDVLIVYNLLTVVEEIKKDITL